MPGFERSTGSSRRRSTGLIETPGKPRITPATPSGTPWERSSDWRLRLSTPPSPNALRRSFGTFRSTPGARPRAHSSGNTSGARRAARSSCWSVPLRELRRDGPLARRQTHGHDRWVGGPPALGCRLRSMASRSRLIIGPDGRAELLVRRQAGRRSRPEHRSHVVGRLFSLGGRLGAPAGSLADRSRLRFSLSARFSRLVGSWATDATRRTGGLSVRLWSLADDPSHARLLNSLTSP